ncbi:MAG: maleylpyruvate isomerase N-terminal domain-containing protein [Nakamurella sp.]
MTTPVEERAFSTDWQRRPGLSGPCWGLDAMSDSPPDIVDTFASAATFYTDLVDTIAASALTGPGLGDWDLRALVGHTSRSLTTVTTYLGQPADRVEVESAAAYYVWVVQQVGADPAAVAERGRQAGIALGDDPAAAVRRLSEDAVAAVRAVEGDPVIHTMAGGMRLSDYLPTRIFELVVHTFDIAAALNRDVVPPAEALADAVDLATELAGLKGDGPALLLALTGRKPLPEGYSVL